MGRGRWAGNRRWLAIPIAAAIALTAAVGCASTADDGTATATTTAPVSTSTPPSEATGLARPTGPIVIAHRGASGYAPEHTTAAYDLAVDQGADYLEQDIQMTADGELVVLHDPILDRTARGPAESCTGAVTERTLAQIRECEVGSWFNDANPELADPAFVGLPVPTLGEVFDRYGPEVRYYIEIKDPDSSPGVEEALLALLDDAALDGDPDVSRQVLIQSFSAESLRSLHAQRPELPLVQLLAFDQTPVDDALLDDIATYAVAIGPIVGNVDADLIERAHARCLEVHPYTVDDPAQMAAMLDAGVDGMFTNLPDILRAASDGRSTPVHCGTG